MRVYRCRNCGYELKTALRITKRDAQSKCPKCQSKRRLTEIMVRTKAPASRWGRAAGDDYGVVFSNGHLVGGEDE